LGSSRRRVGQSVITQLGEERKNGSGGREAELSKGLSIAVKEENGGLGFLLLKKHPIYEAILPGKEIKGD